MSYRPEPIHDALGRLKERAIAEFRAVPVSGRRVGVQLERVFWDALTSLGEQSGMKRSELVELVFRKATGSGIAVASALRCTVAEILLDRVLQQRESRGVEEVAALLQEAPMPAYAIDRSEQVVQLNSEFVQYARQLLGEPDRLLTSTDVALEFETPPRLLFGLAPGSAALTAVTLRIGSLQRRAMTKIVPVPPTPVTRLVGYLTT